MFYAYSNKKESNKDSYGIENLSKPLIVNGCGEQDIKKTDLFCERENGLDDYLLMYVHRGHANYLLNSHEKKVPAGNIVIYTPKTPQKMCYLASESPLVYWVHFTGYEASSLLKDCGLENKNVFNIGINDELTQHFLSLIELLKGYSATPHICISAELMKIFSIITSSLYSKNKNTEPENIKAAIELLTQNIAENFSCTQLARVCNLSESHFMHSFKKWAGISPKAFQLHLRMAKARELLFLTQFSVKEIALRTGYENQLYFSRLFAKYNGCSPSEYRVKKGQV